MCTEYTIFMVAIQRPPRKTKCNRGAMQTVSLSDVFKVERWGKSDTSLYFWPPTDKEIDLKSIRRCYNNGGESVVVTWEAENRRWMTYHMKYPNKVFKME